MEMVRAACVAGAVQAAACVLLALVWQSYDWLDAAYVHGQQSAGSAGYFA